jgi:hypothetical protein
LPGDPIQFADHYNAIGVTSGFDHSSYVADWDNNGSVDLLVRDSAWPTAGDGFSPEYSALSIDQAGQVTKKPTALSGLPFELSAQINPTMLRTTGRPQVITRYGSLISMVMVCRTPSHPGNVIGPTSQILMTTRVPARRMFLTIPT